MVGFSTDKGRTALVSQKMFLAGNSNGGVGHHGDDGHGMHFSQPNVTKRFRGLWLITFQPFVTCYCGIPISLPAVLPCESSEWRGKDKGWTGVMDGFPTFSSLEPPQLLKSG